MAQLGGSGLRSLWVLQSDGDCLKSSCRLLYLWLKQVGFLRPPCLFGLSKVAASWQLDSPGTLSKSFRSQTTSLRLCFSKPAQRQGKENMFFLSRNFLGFLSPLLVVWSFNYSIFSSKSLWWWWWLRSLVTLNLNLTFLIYLSGNVLLFLSFFWLISRLSDSW